MTATPIEPAGEVRSVQGELALPRAADILLRLDPEWVQWLGQDMRTSVVLTNQSGRLVTVALEADDKANAFAFEFVGGARSAIAAGQTLDVPLRISCPDTTRATSGGAVFTVTATPIEPAGERRSVQGELALPGPPDFRPWLEPERVHGSGPEQVRLVVENLSHRTATFVVSTRCRDEGLVVSANATRIEVAAQDQVSVPILLSPRGGAPSLGPGGEPHASGFVVRVAPVDAPTAANEVAGSYVFTQAKLAIRLQPKQIDATGSAVFTLRVENGGDSDVTAELEALDRTGACAIAFDNPHITIPPRSSTQVSLVVTPPPDHGVDAHWPFEVLVRPTSPPGDSVREEGILKYRPPALALDLIPSERRDRRPRSFTITLRNPTASQIAAHLAAAGSADLKVRLPQGRPGEPITVAPNGVVDIPLRATPLRRPSDGERTLSFTVTATPVSPPGTALTADGRFIVLAPRRWPSLRWPLLLLLLAVLGTMVWTEVVEIGEALLILGPLAGGLVLRSWKWVAVCIAAFAIVVLALSIDDSAAEALGLSPSPSLDKEFGIVDGGLVSDVRKILPPDASANLPGFGDDTLKHLEEIGSRGPGLTRGSAERVARHCGSGRRLCYGRDRRWQGSRVLQSACSKVKTAHEGAHPRRPVLGGELRP